MAEVMFSRLAPCLAAAALSENQDTLEPATAEVLADLCYEVGKDLLKKKDYVVAVRWLERAYDTLTMRDIERMSVDSGELRCSVLHYLGECLPLLAAGSELRSSR